MKPLLLYFITFITGYLCGSVMNAQIITRLVKGSDIREMGNNNPGAANTYKNVGPFWGILAGVLDALKALVPLLIGHIVFDLQPIALGFLGFGAVIGHGHPLYFGFRGGRAAGTLMGVFLYFIPFELLAGFILSPMIVYTLIKTDRSYWTPFGIITISALTALFTNHPVEIKIIVIAVAVLGLFLNRFYLPEMAGNLKSKTRD
ncbi:MAG: putative glycerol-3-phosphate acyltransferase [Bacteroidetes bacterium ADurb.Bin145]|jgi:glycerol-3-phosphate acyltransferase PlsY|nr:MAG: putative glycerol-3-phosphate acyltransferase [Bacteroidetes bacterium ADurb.Bin145]HQG37446.1 glycerol-3-phosphate acyltransferase [Bacteroidales bacterium]HQG53348.1 glycerol-3-phosphate acyltransferase [Bacteroidales bacterium]